MDPTDDARWRAYQAWLRKHGDGFTEPPEVNDASPTPALSPEPSHPPSRATPATPLARALMAVAALVLVLAAGVMVSSLRHGPRSSATLRPGAAADALTVDADAVIQPKPSQALPCFVNGHPVGDMPLGTCARRNGVASGKLDVGLDRPPPPGPPAVTRVPLPAALEPEAALPVRAVDAGDSLRTVRQFYQAVAEGDEDGAAELLAPERRSRGALAAARLARSSADAPLRITEILSLGPSSVFVRYEVADPDGDACVGAAHIDTVVRGDETLVRSIHAMGGC